MFERSLEILCKTDSCSRNEVRTQGIGTALARPDTARALAQQRYWHALKLRILLSLAQAGPDMTDTALDELAQALQIASHEGFVLTFRDEGPALMKLVDARAQAMRAQLLDGAGEPATTAHTLSAREPDVLRMLSAGHRNRVIAEKRFVPELTAKAPLRKINAKLRRAELHPWRGDPTSDGGDWLRAARGR